MPDRTILLGTGPIEAVEASYKALSTEKCTLFVNDTALPKAKEFCPDAKGFGDGMLAKHPGRLFRLLALSRPSRVIAVSGPIFYHYELMETIALFMKLIGLGKSPLEVWKDGRLHDYPRASGPRNLLADIGVLVVLALVSALIILVSSVGVWLTVVACIAAYELVLHFFSPSAKEIPLSTPVTIESKTQHSGNRTTGTLKVANSGISHDFSYTFIDRGLARHRVTTLEPEKTDRPEIALLGASVTIGSFIEDDETYGWLLQKQFPKFEFNNYARSGNTTYDQLLDLRHLLQKETLPKAVVALYAPNLDQKLAPDYLSIQYEKLIQPHWRMTGNGLKELSGRGYAPWFMGKTYLGWVIHQFLAHLYTRWVLAGADYADFSRRSISLMREECEANGVEFIVATAFGCGAGRSYLEQEGFNWVDCCQLEDGNSMEEAREKWTIFPLDAHPNASANEIFANHIGDVISACRSGRSGVAQKVTDEGLVPDSTFEKHLDVYPLF